MLSAPSRTAVARHLADIPHSSTVPPLSGERIRTLIHSRRDDSGASTFQPVAIADGTQLACLSDLVGSTSCITPNGRNSPYEQFDSSYERREFPLRIGVTTDFSNLARTAYGASAAIANAFDAELSLIHQAYLDLSAEHIAFDLAAYYSAVEGHLANVVRKTEDFQQRSVTPHLIRGSDIRSLAQELNTFDLIVTASHGRSGLKRMFLGSFAEKIVRLCACNVLVTRRDTTDFQPKRILVAHDFTKENTSSVEVACEWAKCFGAEIKFFTVVDTQHGLTRSVDPGTNWGTFYDLVRQNAMHQLEKLISDGRWGDLLPAIEVVDGEPAAQVIAESGNFDLVVVGRHAERFLIGGVAEKVVRHAECPVLVVGNAEPS